MTCATCEFCNTDEAERHFSVGMCAHPDAFMAHKPVPDWLSGCPDYLPDRDRLSQSALDAIAARGPNVMRRLSEQR